MVEHQFAALSAFDGLAVAGRFGAGEAANAGVLAAERLGVRLLNICAAREQAADARAAIEATCGIAPPSGARRASAGDVSLVGIAPGRWLAVGETARAGALIETLAQRLTGLAATADQSDGYGVLRLTGERVRDALAKGCPIDLDPSVFGIEHAATVPIASVPCRLWQIDLAPTFDVLVPRSYARSFWEWLLPSSMEFGLEVLQAQ